jgi:hypothetical protein
MRTLQLDGSGNRNQDRSIQPSAIVGELPPRALAPPTPTPRPTPARNVVPPPTPPTPPGPGDPQAVDPPLPTAPATSVEARGTAPDAVLARALAVLAVLLIACAFALVVRPPRRIRRNR